MSSPASRSRAMGEQAEGDPRVVLQRKPAHRGVGGGACGGAGGEERREGDRVRCG